MSDQRRALVLGGGGITGIAWEIGVLAGLAGAGVDLTGADLVVGTSAGSVVGAQVGARYGRHIPSEVLRWIVVIGGAIVAVILLVTR